MQLHRVQSTLGVVQCLFGSGITAGVDFVEKPNCLDTTTRFNYLADLFWNYLSKRRDACCKPDEVGYIVQYCTVMQSIVFESKVAPWKISHSNEQRTLAVCVD